MKKEPVPLSGPRQVVAKLLDEKRLDWKGVSLAIGRSHSFIHQWLTYSIPRELKDRDRRKLAAYLLIDENALLEAGALRNLNDISTKSPGSPNQGNGKIEFDRFRSGLPAIGRKDLPIRGTATGGTLGEFLLMVNDIVDYAYRPAALADAKNAYGILVRGTSMQPRWFPGESAFANPDKEAKGGDFVIVQIEAEEGEIEGLIKQLVRQDQKTLVLKQLNPEMEIKIPMAKVRAVHRIYWPNELLGI